LLPVEHRKGNTGMVANFLRMRPPSAGHLRLFSLIQSEPLGALRRAKSPDLPNPVGSRNADPVPRRR
jgi:hypothetical protein